MLIRLFSHNSKALNAIADKAKKPFSEKRAIRRSTTIISLLLAAIMITATQFVWSQPFERSSVLDSSIGFDIVPFGEHKIHYAFSGDTDKPGVLFVHGTPGGWPAFEGYLENKTLQNEFFMVSVDRVGWGLSTLPEGQRMSSDFTLQADGIVEVMRRYPEKKWTIVGHSLGASLAPQIALQAPEQVGALLLLAGSLNPKLGSPRWYNRAASTWLVSKLIGKMMTNSNREIMGLRKELQIMSEKIDQTKLNARLMVMQGMKDRLVSPKNPDYAATAWHGHFLSVDVMELPEEGHFLPWRQTPLVIETIRFLNRPLKNTAQSGN